MSVIVLASASGAPGVTSAALATTNRWRRTAVLVEADTSVTSSVLAGYFRGSRYHTSGLTNLLALDASRQLTPTTALGQCLPLGTDGRSVIPGFASLEAGASSRSFWPSLADTLRGLSHLEHDVLIDAGRWRTIDDRTPLLEAADLVLLTCRPQLPEILAARETAARIRSHVDTNALQALQLVTINDERSDRYSAGEIAQVVGSPVLAELAHDSKSAHVYSHGSDAPQRLERRPYARSIQSLIANLEAALAKRSDVLTSSRHMDGA